MEQHKEASEINYHILKFIVGLVAILLAFLTSELSQSPLTSISASYWDPGHWPRNIFVGFLFAISAFLFAYNGYNILEKYLSKLAALAALGVAMFPCACSGNLEIIPKVHYVSAAIMFGVLLVFSYFFYKRASKKETPEAKVRSIIYLICAFAILAAMLGMLVDFVSNESLTNAFPRFTFYAEMTGLVAFGIAWLIASRVIPYVTGKNERLSLF